MTTFTISLPTTTAKLLDQEVTKRGFATRSEFFRDLIRKYVTHDLVLTPFVAQPLADVAADLTKTGKYSPEFIKSVTAGLSKSSAYAD